LKETLPVCSNCRKIHMMWPLSSNNCIYF
jgi:hypothetical protein